MPQEEKGGKIGQKNLIKLGRQGIVCESREEFEQSVFNKIYERALALTKQSVETQINQSGNSKLQDRRDNIITFIGRRGTGKTSAMLSFMESLRKNGIEYGEGGDKVRFVGLDWIDASLLEEGEDIFELILAKMLGEFLDKDDDNHQSGMELRYEMRDLHQKFGNIYKKVLNLKKRSGGQSYGDETAISVLRELARSNDLHKDFEELVKRYIEVLRMMNEEGAIANYAKTFLVVAIDDVDMNVESGFEILEKIQRYLKVDGLIVLLAINYEQMLICCEKHFAKVYSDHSGYAPETKSHYVSRIAEEYMDKALPSYMRLYLPSLKKRDYERNIIAVKEDGEEMTLKEAVFFLSEKKLKVRYDTLGRKRHFLEPNSLRNLSSQYLFQKAMADLNENDNNFLELLDTNFRKKMDDLLFRYTFENLRLKERTFITELSEEDIKRRGEIVISRFLGELNKKLSNKDKSSLWYINKSKQTGVGYVHEFQEEFKIYGYSYGTLMRCFYFLEKEKLFEKELVDVLLDMYTIVLTRAFYHYKMEMGQSGIKEKYYRMLKEILTSSVGGTWSLYLMPMMKRLGNQYYSGAVKSAALNGAVLADSKVLSDCFEKLEIAGDDNEIRRQMADIIENLTPQIIVLLFLTEFHTEHPSEYKYGLKIETQAGIQPHSDSITESSNRKLVFSEVRADFNVLNFINNIFVFDEIMDSFIGELFYVIAGKNDADTINKYVEDIKQDLLERETSFYKSMTEWKRKYGGMAVPVYSTDIFYNMLKRMERELKKKTVRAISEEQLFSCLQSLLKDIEEYLRKNDSYYEKAISSESQYVVAFENCPVIQKLMETGDTPTKELYNTFVGKIIRGDNANEKLLQFDILRMLMD